MPAAAEPIRFQSPGYPGATRPRPCASSSRHSSASRCSPLCWRGPGSWRGPRGSDRGRACGAADRIWAAQRADRSGHGQAWWTRGGCSAGSRARRAGRRRRESRARAGRGRGVARRTRDGGRGRDAGHRSDSVDRRRQMAQRAARDRRARDRARRGRGGERSRAVRDAGQPAPRRLAADLRARHGRNARGPLPGANARRPALRRPARRRDGFSGGRGGGQGARWKAGGLGEPGLRRTRRHLRARRCLVPRAGRLGRGAGLRVDGGPDHRGPRDAGEGPRPDAGAVRAVAGRGARRRGRGHPRPDRDPALGQRGSRAGRAPGRLQRPLGTSVEAEDRRGRDLRLRGHGRARAALGGGVPPPRGAAPRAGPARARAGRGAHARGAARHRSDDPREDDRSGRCARRGPRGLDEEERVARGVDVLRGVRGHGRGGPVHLRGRPACHVARRPCSGPEAPRGNGARSGGAVRRRDGSHPRPRPRAARPPRALRERCRPGPERPAVCARGGLRRFRALVRGQRGRKVHGRSARPGLVRAASLFGRARRIRSRRGPGRHEGRVAPTEARRARRGHGRRSQRRAARGRGGSRASAGRTNGGLGPGRAPPAVASSSTGSLRAPTSSRRGRTTGRSASSRASSSTPVPSSRGSSSPWNPARGSASCVPRARAARASR